MPGMVDTHVQLWTQATPIGRTSPQARGTRRRRGHHHRREHTHAHPIRSVADLNEKRRYLAGRANVDFGLVAHVWPDRIEAMETLAVPTDVDSASIERV